LYRLVGANSTAEKLFRPTGRCAFSPTRGGANNPKEGYLHQTVFVLINRPSSAIFNEAGSTVCLTRASTLPTPAQTSKTLKIIKKQLV
jgi:hypothetical protein